MTLNGVMAILWCFQRKAVGFRANQAEHVAYLSARAGFKGGGEDKLGSCPGASTSKGPPQKTVKKYLRKHIFILS